MHLSLLWELCVPWGTESGQQIAWWSQHSVGRSEQHTEDLPSAPRCCTQMV